MKYGYVVYSYVAHSAPHATVFAECGSSCWIFAPEDMGTRASAPGLPIKAHLPVDERDRHYRQRLTA